MTAVSRLFAAVLVGLTMAGCTAPSQPSNPSVDPPTRDFLDGPTVRDSAYLAVDRAAAPPRGYGLYTTVLTRSVNRNAVLVLSEIFTTTSSSADAVIARENLNLIVIPVKSASEVDAALAGVREDPEPIASQLLLRSYDFGHASKLLASICRPARGAAVMKVCGSGAPDGPILVTSQRPFDPAAPLGERLLVVNLGTAAPEAVGEIVAAYRRQILRKDFADRAEIDHWRLVVLNVALDASSLLPNISKAYAGGK